MSFIVKEATTEAEINAVMQLRKLVFVEEQGVSEEEEWDEFEKTSTHVLLVSEDNLPLGSARFRQYKDCWKIERVCVHPNHRRKDIGKAVMQATEELAYKRAQQSFMLHAQTQALPFYTAIGYTVVSDIFIEADIEHVVMKK